MKTLISLLFVIASAMPVTAQNFAVSKTIDTEPESTYPPELYTLAFLNNRVVLTGDSHGQLRAWNVNTGKALWRTDAGAYGQPVYEIAIQPSGGGFFAISLKGVLNPNHARANSVQLFNNSGAHLTDIRGVLGLHVGIVFKDRRTLYATGRGQNHQFNVGQPTEPRRVNNANKEGFSLGLHGTRILATALSQNGTYFAVASQLNTGNAVLKLTRGTARTNTLYESGPNYKVNALAFSPTEHRLVAGRQDGAIQIWERHSAARWLHKATLRRQLGDLENKPITDIAYHPDGRWVAAAHEDGTLNLWDTERRAHSATLYQRQQNNPSLDFSPDGQWLVSGGHEGKLHLWRYIDGDVNGDGKINIGDLRAILNNYGKKQNADGTLRRGDVNADGIVNRRDLALVAEIVEGIEGIPAAPMLRRLGLQTWGDMKRR